MTSFPAKLLLFGEYSILLGSTALSMPLSLFSASLGFMERATRAHGIQAAESNAQLKYMLDYFTAEKQNFEAFLDLSALDSDLKNGLCLFSDIPQRYGMGSSGALCAAVFSHYCIGGHNITKSKGPEDLRLLRNYFVMMESCFHGRSSGFDPLVSYLQTPLLLGKSGDITAVDFNQNTMPVSGIKILLADTGMPCSTGPLVDNFLQLFSPGRSGSEKGAELCSMADDVIIKFLNGDEDSFWNELGRLSYFEVVWLNHLVPAKLLPLWAHGLETGLFTLKLCGSGGGGFLICFTRSMDKTIEYFNANDLPYISLT
jgi:mevalonate kinase